MTEENDERKSPRNNKLAWDMKARFYLEGIEKGDNLLELDIDEDLFMGRLHSLVLDAKLILSNLKNSDIIDILYFGDLMISRMIDDQVKIQEADGSLRAITEKDLDSIAYTDFLPLIIAFLGEHNLRVSEQFDPVEKALHITPARFCAAVALAEAYRAVEFNYDRNPHLDSFGGYHALQMAETMAIAKILDRDGNYLAPLIASRAFADRARKGATAKLDRDSNGKQAAKRRTHEQWLAWQDGRTIFKSGAAFARHIVDTLPIENAKTVERWMRAWRLERTRRSSC